jgi:hypothetical protein
MPNYNTSAPPTYSACESDCYHDLARAALVWDELLDRDGPFDPNLSLVLGSVNVEALPPPSDLT